MTKHIWLAIALFFSPTLKATPTGLVVLHSQLTQFLIALLEHHELVQDQENMPYLQKMVDILSAREKLSNNDCQLLLEVSVPLMKFGRSPGEVDLLIDLNEIVEGLGCLRTKIKNIEMRRFSIAAACMLNPKQDPAYFTLNLKRNGPDSAEFRQLAFESFGCKMDDITFNDVLEELSALLQQVEFIGRSWNTLPIKNEFAQGIQSAAQGRADIIDLLNRYGIDKNKEILAASYTMYESIEGRVQRSILENGIKRVSSAIFDLFLLNHVLHLKRAQKNIILIAGGDHVGALIGSLGRIHAYENLSSHFNGCAPLHLETLDLLLMSAARLKELKEHDNKEKLPLVC